MSELDDLNARVISEFRANNGLVGGNFKGSNLLLLHTIGARSGVSRVNPVAYLKVDESWIIIASFAGSPSNPPWFHNLKAHPKVDVEVGKEMFKAKATIMEEPERSDLYAKVEGVMPVFTQYQAKTNRVIPVISLTKI